MLLQAISSLQLDKVNILYYRIIKEKCTVLFKYTREVHLGLFLSNVIK